MKFLLLVAVAGLVALASANIQVPGLPGLPGLPGNLGLPNVPGLPSVPGLPNIPGLPNVPGLPNLLPKRKRDVMDSFTNLVSNPEFMNQFFGLLKQFGGQLMPRPSKRDILGLFVGPESLPHLPIGWATDIAAGGKMAVDSIKENLGKRSADRIKDELRKRSILDETRKVQKRDVITDLFNMLIGNFEGTMTGMDIGR